MPSIFASYFTQNTSVHNYNTREKYSLHFDNPHTEFGKRFVKFKDSKGKGKGKSIAVCETSPHSQPIFLLSCRKPLALWLQFSCVCSTNDQPIQCSPCRLCCPSVNECTQSNELFFNKKENNNTNANVWLNACSICTRYVCLYACLSV